MGAGLPRPRSAPAFRAPLRRKKRVSPHPVAAYAGPCSSAPSGKGPAVCVRFRRGRRVPAPTARAMGAGLPAPAARKRFECPKDTRNASRRTAPLATPEPTARTSPQRFGGLAVPVAQSSRRALAAPTARFAPHLRVALSLRPKCPLGTRFPPVPSKLKSESSDMRGGFGSLAQARLPYAGRRLRRREACALWALARSAKRPVGVSKYKGCARPARRTPIFARCRRQSRRRSRRPAQPPSEKIGASRAFPTRS